MTNETRAVPLDEMAGSRIRRLLDAGWTTSWICQYLGVSGIDVREEMLGMKAAGHPRYAGMAIPHRQVFSHIGGKPVEGA